MDGWLPIAAAPKDGTPIIGARFEGEDMAFCGAAFWETPEVHRLHYGWAEVVESEAVWCAYHEQHGVKCGRETQDLTHWLPMPTAPHRAGGCGVPELG